MSELTVTPGPIFYHDYAQQPLEPEGLQPSCAAGCQTEITMEDILMKAEEAEQVDVDPSDGMPDVVEWATQTDERVNFYTGIRSQSLLNGK